MYVLSQITVHKRGGAVYKSAEPLRDHKAPIPVSAAGSVSAVQGEQ